MKQVFFLFSVLLFSLFHSQVSDKTLSIIKPLETYKSFRSLNEEPREIKKKLEQSASTEELIYLANNGKNPYIKSVSAEVLINRKENRILDIFKNSIHSQEEIKFTTECLSDAILLPAYIFEIAISNPDISEDYKTKLTEELANIVLQSKPVNIKLLEQIRYSIPETPENYSILRQLVIESKSSELLISLAKYQNQNDIELIKSFGKHSFLAIEKFPDEKFLPFLNENIENSKEFPFMFALSSFCNPEAKIILDKVIEFEKNENKKNNCGNVCLNIFYQQINQNKCSFFQPSLENLWLTDKIISFDVLDNYEKNNSKEKVVEFIMKGFLQAGEPKVIASNMYDIENVTDDLIYDEELRLIKLLERIKPLSDSAYSKAVANVLQFIYDLNTPRFISKLNDNPTLLQHKDILLEKLRTNENAYGLISIMDGIKLLKDQKLYNEGVQIVVQRKSEFLESPVWKKAYKEFIQDNNIKE